MSTGTQPPHRAARGSAARPPSGSVPGWNPARPSGPPARPTSPGRRNEPARSGDDRPTTAAVGSGAGAPSRVSVLAPRTRIDVALPPDVPLADLLPMLLDLAGETGRDGTGRDGTGRDGTGDDDADETGRPGGWTLAPLGQAAAEAHRTLASLGVLDGDQLVLRRRSDAAPAPLFDDVVDAVAEATPASFRAWGPAWARRLGLLGLAGGPLVAAAALVVAGRGPGTAGGVVTAAVAGALAIVCVVLGAVWARPMRQPAAGAVLAAGGVLLAAVAGLAAVPGGPLVAGIAAPNLLLAAVLGAVVAAVSLLVLGTASRSGLAALVGVLTAAGLLAVAAAVATAADAQGPGTAASVASGAGAVALVALSLLPRTSIALARLPLPQVPGSAEELADDPGTIEHAVLEQRADRAHAAMNGLVSGCGAVTTGAVAVLAAAPAPGLRGGVGWGLAVLLVVLLALRSRTYANGVQAVALLGCALLGGVALGLGAIASAPDSRWGTLVLLVVVPLVALAAGTVALLLGVAVPGRRFSPVARRGVDVLEAIGIAAVLPVALAVMDLYTAVRLW